MSGEDSEMSAEGRRKKIQEWVSLAGKMFPDPIGVFWYQLEVPCGHIGPIFDSFWGLGTGPYMAPKGPLHLLLLKLLEASNFIETHAYSN